MVTPSEPDWSDLRELMRSFQVAYLKADADGLKRCLTPDFVWHLHRGDASHGRTLEGVEAMIEETRRRQATWSEMRYDDNAIHYADGLITQTFLISGMDEHGARFSNRVADLYTVREGRIASKDTYWKQVTS